MLRPTTTMTIPIGMVKIIRRGRKSVPSRRASSLAGESVTWIRGKNAKISPPSETSSPNIGLRRVLDCGAGMDCGEGPRCFINRDPMNAAMTVANRDCVNQKNRTMTPQKMIHDRFVCGISEAGAVRVVGPVSTGGGTDGAAGAVGGGGVTADPWGCVGGGGTADVDGAGSGGGGGMWEGSSSCGMSAP